MRIRKLLFMLFIFILWSAFQTGQAQPAGNNPALRKAIAEYQGLKFESAIKELNKVLEKDPANVMAQEMLAGSNRNLKNYEEAVYWYGELCKLNTIKPEWALYYAEALANKERYEESEQWYRKFLSMRPNDRRASAFSKANFESFSRNAGEYKVIFSSINTDASEYSPMYYKDGLMFISNRDQKSRYVFQWDRTFYSDIYLLDDLRSLTEGETDSLGAVRKKPAKSSTGSFNKEPSLMSLFSSAGAGDEAIDEPYLLRGKVRSNFHEGPAVLLPEGNLMFTRNNFSGGRAGRSRNGVNKLKIYTASGTNWEKITSFLYNNNEYSTGHPTLSRDGNILIFASDMPRGFGGTDLYYCVRTGEGRSWGRPVNLGPKINTEGHEQFPFLDKNGVLYFSSTGHPGLGGLDIFEVVLKDMKAMTSPRNLGTDINSSSDDFGFIHDDSGKTGFFSSNRRGNDDIFQFTHMPYTVALKGIVVDADTNKPLPGSKVVIRHNGFIDTISVNSVGEFVKVLAKETDYELAGSRFSYVSGQSLISTGGISVDSTISVILKLSKAQNSQQWVIDNCESLKKTFAFQNIYYDLDRAEIRNDARQALDEIVQVMQANPEIRIITSSHTDSRATDSYNRELSLRRGQAAKAYLVSRGVNAGRIEVKYYGKSRLLNACDEDIMCLESEQQINRRTEFEVIVHGVNLSLLNCQKEIKN